MVLKYFMFDKEFATVGDCPNRLLGFAKVRNTVRSGALASQSAARQIINRFCNVVGENERMGLWSLDLLQMCSVHGGDHFVLSLNNQARLNDLIAFLMNPIKAKSVSLQIRMKIWSLIEVSQLP